MMMVIVVIKRSHLAYRSMTNDSNVPGDAVNAFVYAKITAYLGLYLVRGKSLYISDVCEIDVICSSLCSLLI